MDILIVSGMSGSGKSRAMAALEDLGFYCVDNMPPALIPSFVEICASSGGSITKVAFVADARGAERISSFFAGLDKLLESGHKFKLLFLDASDEVLISRYKETRRKHPLADKHEGSLKSAIEEERRLLSGLQTSADYIIDTSRISAAQLREHLVKIFNEGQNTGFIVNIESFGFKFGPPKDADMMLDVRCFPNPFYIDELKYKSGLDPEVKAYLLSSPEVKRFISMLSEMLAMLIPLYIKEGKSSLVIAIGCTGGRHRSVTISEEINEFINKGIAHSVVAHRDISRG